MTYDRDWSMVDGSDRWMAYCITLWKCGIDITQAECDYFLDIVEMAVI